MNITTLAIIGTAGRGEDAHRLTLDHWAAMQRAARWVTAALRTDHTQVEYVSGGAAWADHAAVAVAREDKIPLKLFFPAYDKDLDTAKYYHARFSKVLGHDTWEEATNLQAFSIKFRGGFKDRNRIVAEHATHWLAMTFGHGRECKDGGTAHTVNLLRHAYRKPGYHLDLNTCKLYAVQP